jgi:hypothetical protein
VRDTLVRLKHDVIGRKAEHDSRILSQEHTAGLHVLQTSKLYFGVQGILQAGVMYRPTLRVISVRRNND